MKTRSIFIFLAVLFNLYAYSQHEQKKWYFGSWAALDFMNNPPTPISGNMMLTSEGCSSVADGAGNLLFYTNGGVVFDKNHTIMGNTFLLNDESATQTGLSVKKPGSQNIYYVFSLNETIGILTYTLYYNIVDMSLNGGLGALTATNVQLHNASGEKLAATSHCNGTDVWVMSHDFESNVFRAYLITSAGINTVAVTSTVGVASTLWNNELGQMKFSPDGKRLGLAWYKKGFELYDFDPSTGLVSNPLVLASTMIEAYGCEFSPDGSKFYGSRHPPSPSQSGAQFIQWDLCAGSNTAVLASSYSITNASTLTAAYGAGGLQLAPDGKIYIATSYEHSLSVIANPNGAGAACNYMHLAQDLGAGYVAYSLPSVVVYHSQKITTPFTWTASCQTVSFTAPPGLGITTTSCGTSTTTVASLSWLFGDPASPTAGSSATNPQYAYSGPGNFSAKLILHYPCRDDTITVPVAITHSVPLISVSGASVICPGQSISLTASGATSYSWNGVAGPSTFTVAPLVSTNYTVSGINNSSICPTTSTLVSITVLSCTGIDETEPTHLFIYPNPIKTTLSIDTDAETDVTVTDLAGKVVMTRHVTEGHTDVGCEQLHPGIYFIHLRSKKESRVMRMIRSE